MAPMQVYEVIERVATAPAGEYQLNSEQARRRWGKLAGKTKDKANERAARHLHSGIEKLAKSDDVSVRRQGVPGQPRDERYPAGVYTLLSATQFKHGEVFGFAGDAALLSRREVVSRDAVTPPAAPAVAPASGTALV